MKHGVLVHPKGKTYGMNDTGITTVHHNANNLKEKFKNIGHRKHFGVDCSLETETSKPNTTGSKVGEIQKPLLNKN